jgi:hypothetical protein
MSTFLVRQTYRNFKLVSNLRRGNLRFAAAATHVSPSFAVNPYLTSQTLCACYKAALLIPFPCFKD